MPKLRFSKQNAFLGHQQSVYCLSSDSQSGFFSAGSEGKMVHWPSIHSSDGFLFAQISEAVFSLKAVSPDLIFAGTQSGTLYRLERAKEPVLIPLMQKGIFDIQLDDVGNLWVAGGSGTLFTFTQDLELLGQLKLSQKSLRTITFDSQNEWVVGSSDGHIYSQFQDPKQISEMSVFQIKSNFEGGWICTGRDAQLRILDSAFEEIQKVNAHWFTIHALSISPSGKMIASGSMDKSIRIWKRQNLELLLSIGNRAGTIHKSSVNALLWMDEETLISCSDDAQIYCWKIIHDTDI
jgi:WD40 repeat protein